MRTALLSFPFSKPVLCLACTSNVFGVSRQCVNVTRARRQRCDACNPYEHTHTHMYVDVEVYPILIYNEVRVEKLWRKGGVIKHTDPLHSGWYLSSPRPAVGVHACFAK